MAEILWLMPEIRLVKPACIGIGGVSRSGKTFLANHLNAAIPDSDVIHQDTFIPDEPDIPKINDHIDWERPEAIDWVSFRKAIESGINSGKTVIVEGLFAFHDKEINTFYNKTIFITLSRDEFIRRKRTDLRWGREPEWYISHIWEGYLNYGQLPEEIVNPLLLDGTTDFNPSDVITYLQL
jgi:nicotinamide/nicotinate riboside kinase